MEFSDADAALRSFFDPGELAVLKTVAYADIFNFPLTFSELFTYLIAPLAVDQGVLQAKSDALAARGIITSRQGYYYLPGRDDLVPLRQSRVECAKKKWLKAAFWGRLFKVLPWLKLVGVSGALAMDNSDGNDDIDLVFITAERRLWLTRLLVVLLFKITGQYRKTGRIEDRFCPNLFISEEAIGGFKRNLYVAHEVTQLRPVWDRENIYLRFLAANNWVGSFLPHTLTPPPLASSSSRVGWVRPFSALLDRLENLVMHRQLEYMRRKKTIEVTTAQMILLHPRDTTTEVTNAFHDRLQKLHPAAKTVF